MICQSRFGAHKAIQIKPNIENLLVAVCPKLTDEQALCLDGTTWLHIMHPVQQCHGPQEKGGEFVHARLENVATVPIAHTIPQYVAMVLAWYVTTAHVLNVKQGKPQTYAIIIVATVVTNRNVVLEGHVRNITVVLSQ